MMTIFDYQTMNLQKSRAADRSDPAVAVPSFADDTRRLSRQEEGSEDHSSLATLQAANLRLQEANRRLAEQVARGRRQIHTLESEKHALQQANDTLEIFNTQLALQARTDGLTGLINHRTFQEHLREEMKRAVRYAAPLSLLFLDVDAFKTYNDRYGHPAGDAALCKIADALRATARANDLIARYGGEEFAAILPETNVECALLAAERFRAAVQAVRWQERQITVSIGVATLSSDIREPSGLIAQADNALYHCKASGRNCVAHSRHIVQTESLPDF